MLTYAGVSCAKYNAGHNKNVLFGGQLLATGRGDGVVAIWDMETKGILRWFKAHIRNVTKVA